MSDAETSDEGLPLDLPEIGTEDDEGEGVEADDVGALEPALFQDDEDPFDDEVADEIPIELTLATTRVEPSAIGDDATGLDDAAGAEGVHFAEDAGSLLGSDEDGTDFGGDDELGIDPIPTEVDDGGLEGIDDPAEQHIDDALPLLDGTADDDTGDELDVDLDVPLPPLER